MPDTKLGRVGPKSRLGATSGGDFVSIMPQRRLGGRLGAPSGDALNGGSSFILLLAKFCVLGCSADPAGGGGVGALLLVITVALVLGFGQRDVSA